MGFSSLDVQHITRKKLTSPLIVLGFTARTFPLRPGAGLEALSPVGEPWSDW